MPHEKIQYEAQVYIEGLKEWPEFSSKRSLKQTYLGKKLYSYMESDRDFAGNLRKKSNMLPVLRTYHYPFDRIGQIAARTSIGILLFDYGEVVS